MNGTITAEDLDRLRHMLGADPRRYTQKQWGFRNYYACGGGEPEQSMRRLEAAGFVQQGCAYKDSFYFHATEDGCKAAGMNAAQIKRALED
jgi:hypothetical protein